MECFEENLIIEQKPKINYDELDAELIEKLRNNEINVDETVKNLEKLYKGEWKFSYHSKQILKFIFR